MAKFLQYLTYCKFLPVMSQLLIIWEQAMNFLIVKQVSILSFIFGTILGLIILLPVLNLVAFLFAMFATGGAMVILLKKFNLIGLINIREGAVIGAIAGFASFIGLCVIYLPVSSLIGLIFPKYTGGFFSMFFTSFGGFVIGLFMVIFSALMSALLNSFGGLFAVWVYEFITGIKKGDNENINFEIK